MLHKLVLKCLALPDNFLQYIRKLGCYVWLLELYQICQSQSEVCLGNVVD